MKKLNFLLRTLIVVILFHSLSAFSGHKSNSSIQNNKRIFAPHISLVNNTSNSVIYFTMAYYDGSGSLISTHDGIAVTSGGSVNDNFPTNGKSVNVSISVGVETLQMLGINCYSTYPSANVTSGSFDISNLATTPTLSASNGTCL